MFKNTNGAFRHDGLTWRFGLDDEFVVADDGPMDDDDGAAGLQLLRQLPELAVHHHILQPCKTRDNTCTWICIGAYQ